MYKDGGDIKDQNEGKWNDLIGIGLAFIAAVAGALAVIYVREMSSTIHYSVIGFYYFVGNILLCPLWSFFQQREFFPKYCLNFALFMVGIGAAYFTMQALMTYSMKFTTSAMSAVLIYITVPVSYLLDYVFFNQKFGYSELTGACLIVVTNCTIGFLKGSGMIS